MNASTSCWRFSFARSLWDDRPAIAQGAADSLTFRPKIGYISFSPFSSIVTDSEGTILSWLKNPLKLLTK